MLKDRTAEVVELREKLLVSEAQRLVAEELSRSSQQAFQTAMEKALVFKQSLEDNSAAGPSKRQKLSGMCSLGAPKEHPKED
jgi:hypothetical protein